MAFKITITILLLLILAVCIINTLKLFKTMEDLQQIKEALQQANQTITESAAVAAKVDADVTALHAKIDGIADSPTAEEWAEVKALAESLKTGSASLKEALIETDAKTDDE